VEEKLRVSLDKPGSIALLQKNILAVLDLLNPAKNRCPVIVCIGTDRCTGDALGPLVGTKINPMIPFEVYGTLSEPVHARNLISYREKVLAQKPLPLIIAIDASLGPMNRVGSINVGPGPLYPGRGVKKELPPIGDMHITGLVNISGFWEHLVLQSTRLDLVYRMAQSISLALAGACRRFFLPSYKAKRLQKKSFNKL